MYTWPLKLQYMSLRLATPPTDWASGTWASAVRHTRPRAGQICLNFYVPERSYMHITVSCWFLISFGIQFYCTGSAARKTVLHWALEARYDTALHFVKVTRGSSCTLNHLWTSDRYDPEVLMRKNPLLRQVGVGWAPNGTRLMARCYFTGPKKV
jgi:hypothetical protein